MKSLSAKKFEEATKLHQILEIALQDLKAVEKMKNKFEVSMLNWYVSDPETKRCNVCLAGSVIARRYWALVQEKLDINPTYNCVDPSDFEGIDDVEYKLGALNELRKGKVGEALWSLNREDEDIDCIPNHELDRSFLYYDGPNGKWWIAIEILLKDLKKADL